MQAKLPSRSSPLHRRWAGRLAWQRRAQWALAAAALLLPLAVWVHPAWGLLSLLPLLYPSRRELPRALRQLDERYGLAYRSALEAPPGHPWRERLEAAARASLQQAQLPRFPWLAAGAYLALLGATWLLPSLPVPDQTATAPPGPSPSAPDLPQPPASSDPARRGQPSEGQPPDPSQPAQPASGQQGQPSDPQGQPSAPPAQPGQSPQPGGQEQVAQPGQQGQPALNDPQGQRTGQQPGTAGGDPGTASPEQDGQQAPRGTPPQGQQGRASQSPRQAQPGQPPRNSRNGQPGAGEQGPPSGQSPTLPQPPGTPNGEAPLPRSENPGAQPRNLPSPWRGGQPPENVQRQAERYLESEPLPPEVRDLLRRYFNLSEQ